MITNESAISRMSMRTTVQILQVRRPHTGVGSQLAQSTMPDMGQDKGTDRQMDSSIAYSPPLYYSVGRDITSALDISENMQPAR